jgi:excisionase family DNA binding protein
MRARQVKLGLEPIAVRIPQAAAMLGIGRSTLYGCIAAGEIETIKVGRSTLVPVDSLTAFVASRRNAELPSRSD